VNFSSQVTERHYGKGVPADPGAKHLPLQQVVAFFRPERDEQIHEQPLSKPKSWIRRKW
jgi:hypothetical protein